MERGGVKWEGAFPWTTVTQALSQPLLSLSLSFLSPHLRWWRLLAAQRGGQRGAGPNPRGSVARVPCTGVCTKATTELMYQSGVGVSSVPGKPSLKAL
jgi:hypothetical protein